MIQFLQQLGAKTVNRVAAVGRAGQLLRQSLIAKPAPMIMFPLLVRQLYFIGVLSLVIIIVSGLFIGMVLGLQGYTILVDYGWTWWDESINTRVVVAL